MNKRKQKRILIFTIGLLVLSIGFAALAAQLKIDGTINVSKNSWDVHFENVDITPGSVTASTAPVTDDVNKNTTEITYAISFDTPGQFYEFTVDMVNAGTIDAMIDTLVNGLFEVDGETAKTLPDYLSCSMKYNDGIDIAQNQKLAANTSEKIKVRVAFRTDINPGDLPSTSGESMKFILKANFKQADENAVKIQRIGVGDYILLTPDKETYTVPGSLTGYTNSQDEPKNQTINIAGTSDADGLRLWRIIDMHNNGSFDVVSEYVSSDKVYFQGSIGYANFVGTLNTIAAQYEKEGYTIGSRMMGYDGQTEYILDTSVFNGTEVPTYTTVTGTPTSGTGQEYTLTSPGDIGDTLYLKDYLLVKDVYGDVIANKVGTTSPTSYWIASRIFTHPNNRFDFHGRIINTSGNFNYGYLRYYGTTSSSWTDRYTNNSVRPILTIKSGLTKSGGDGTKNNPYTFN